MTPIKTTNETLHSYEDNITILFRDGVFCDVQSPLCRPYDRENWRKLTEIGAEITRIEESLKPKAEPVYHWPISTCFEGLPLPPTSLVADPFNPAWRELLDQETYMEGEPFYSFSRFSWHTVTGLDWQKRQPSASQMPLSGVGYRAYKDEFKGFTTRPLPKEEVQS